MKRWLCGLLFTGLVSSAWAVNIWGVDVNGLELQSSVWSIRNAVVGTAPDPVVNTLGASIPFRFLGHWTFRPEAQFFWQNYLMLDGRAVPAADMEESVTLLGVMVNPTAGYELTLNPTLAVVGEGGLGFLLRFPLFLNGKGASDYVLPATSWLLAGRFFYPNLGVGLTWQFSPLFAFTVRGQAFFPVFDLWGGLPFDDEFTYGVGVGIRFTF